jgi:hypothetical protein
MDWPEGLVISGVTCTGLLLQGGKTCQKGAQLLTRMAFTQKYLPENTHCRSDRERDYSQQQAE